MLTVDHYARIRRAKRDGMSVRAIARTFHHSRRKIREALKNPQPRPYTRQKDPYAPKLGPLKAVIDQILADDDHAPRKQRHTAMRIYRRLRDEHGYQGGYDQVRRYVGKQRKRQRETFIPLAHDPGVRLEADFGHLYVDFPEGRRRVSVLITAWSHSAFRFAIALPTERIEAILAGLVAALEFFGCVPHEVWWDNPRTVVSQILKGRRREINRYYAALASHYNFEPLFCMPAHGNEKPYVENSVFDLQRNWGTPVPRVADYDQLNAYLRQCCLDYRAHRIAGQTQTVGERFEQDRTSALPLPERGFDACIAHPADVDKYQTVRFDNNRYSVPRRWAFETVTVKAYVDHIEVAAGSTVIARHARCYLRNQQILEPRHYLAVLGRRPAALDHSGVFRHWRLPTCFAELRERLERREGPFAGARQYIRVLQLLAEHPVERIQDAIERCRAKTALHADLIIQETRRLAKRAPITDQARAGVLDDINLPQVHVPKPDLNRFDQLLTLKEGEPSYVESV